MSMKLHHVGHVVKNLDKARKLYENKLGLTPNRVMKHPLFGAQMVFYPFAGIEIELIKPSGVAGDYAARCLKERGEGIFHLSFAVDNYDAEVKAWREKGFTVEELAVEETGGTIKLAFLKPEEVHGLWIEFFGANLAGSPSD